MKNFRFIIAILVPILLSVFAFFSLLQFNIYKKTITRLKFSETIVQISKYLAQERGFTYVYAHLDYNDKTIIEKLSKASRQVDFYYSKALNYAEQLDEKSYKKLIEFNKKLQELRNINEFMSETAFIRLNDETLISAIDWFENLSNLISDLEEIHVANLKQIINNKTLLGMPSANNFFTSRKAIWDLFELAGQERALIGAAIASNAAIPKEKINAIWLEINRVWLNIQQSMRGNLDGLELNTSFDAIKNKYFGDYQNIREKIILSSSKNTTYPLSANEWLTQSTAAINSLITLSELLSADDIKIIANLNFESSQKRNFVSWFGIFIIIISLIFILFYFVVLFNYKMRIIKVKKLYDLSEKLLLSTSALAYERGISRIVISSVNIPNDSLKQRIEKQRKIVDKLMLPALEDLQSLRIDKYNYLIEGVRNKYRKVTQLRREIDEYLRNTQNTQKESKQKLAEQVFEEFTKLIETTEELQLSAAHTFALDGQRAGFLLSDSIWYKNLAKTAAIRHFIWLMSEHAGRQRALVGSAISSKSCIPFGEIEKWQTKIRSSWDVVKIEVSQGEYNTSVREKLEAVRNKFFDGEYPKILKEVIACSKQNLKNPTYRVEADKWFDISSKAIEKISLLSQAVGKNSEDKLSKMIYFETLRSLFVVLLSISSIILMFATISS